jgi:hypothetical protein
MEIAPFVNGKDAEGWAVGDALSFMQQLGIIPTQKK